jgi:uncharacterized cupredoxin-like copper-binding protein
MPSVPRTLTRGIAGAAGAATLAAALLVPGAVDAKTSLNVKLSEFKVTPAKKSVSHGKVTFVVKNAGDMTHELVVVKTSPKAAKLPVSGGRASETGSVGEIGNLPAGATKRLTLNLKKGHYALICNFAGHYKGGMYADLTVR